MPLLVFNATVAAALIFASPSGEESAGAAPARPATAQPSAIPESKLPRIDAGVQNAGVAPGVKAQNPRILFITSRDSAHCDEELARLRRTGGDFENLQSQGWKIGPGPENHLQIVDRSTVPDLVQQIEARDYPIIVCISGKEIVRSFRTGCTTPLDAWTFGWLAKGVSERPQAEIPEAARVESTGHYPLRGNHWSIDEDWNPTRERVISHLRGPNHGSQIASTWVIESWSYEELRSLHDNLHEQLMGGLSYGHRPKPTQRSFSKN